VAFSKIGLEAVLDVDDFSKNAKVYDKTVDRMDSKTGKTAGRMTKALKGMGKVGGFAMKGLALGAGAAVTGALALGGAVAKMAADARDIPNISASFEGLGGSIEKMREGSLGMVQDVDLMKSFNQAAQLVSKDFAKQLPDAMGMLSKVAAATGEDMGFMIDSLVKGVGRVSPMILDNLGIQVSLTDATAAYAEILGKEAKELTKAEQQTAVMNATMAALKRNTADMPEVAGTTAQSMASLQATMANVKNEIGVAFIPVLQALLTPLAELATKYGPAVVAWAQNASQWIVGSLVPAIGMLVTGFQQFIAGFQAGGSLFESIAWGIGEVLDDFIPEETMNRIWDFLDVLANLGKTSPMVLDNMGALGQAIQVVGDIFQFVGEKAAPVFAQAFELVKGVVADVVAFVGPLLQEMAGFFTEQFGVAVAFVEENMPLIQETITTVFDGIAIALDGLKKVWEAAWPVIQQVVEVVWEAMKIAVETALGTIMGIVKSVMMAITGDWDGAWQNLKETLINHGKGMLEFLKTLVGGLVGIITGATGDFIAAGKAMIDGFIQGIKDKAGAALAAAKSVISGAINGAKGLLGIHSPSTVFIEIGLETMEGLAKGLDKGEAKVLKKVSSALDNLFGAFKNLMDMGGLGNLPDIGAVKGWAAQFVEIAQVLVSAVSEVQAQFGRRRIHKAKVDARKIGQIIERMSVDMSKIKVVDLPDLQEWKTQMIAVTRIVGETIDKIHRDGRLRGLVNRAAEWVEPIANMLSFVNISFEDMTLASSLPDLETWSAQVVDVGVIVANTLIDLETELTKAVIDTASGLTASVSSILSLVTGATAAIKAMAEYGESETSAIVGKMENFTANIWAITTSLIGLSQDMDEDATKAAADMMGHARNILGFVTGGVDAIAAMAEYGFVETRFIVDRMSNFGANVKALVQGLDSVADSLEDGGLDAAGVTLQSAQGMLGIVSAGIDAIGAMASYVHVRSATIGRSTGLFGLNIEHMVRGLNNLATDLEDVETDAANTILTSATGMLGIISEGVNALAAMAEYVHVRSATIGRNTGLFGLNIGHMIKGLNQVASDLEGKATDAAAKILSAAGDMVGFVGTAIGAIKALLEMPSTVNLSAKLTEFKASLDLVLDKIGAIATDWEGRGIPESVDLWNAIGSVTSNVSSAVSLLTDLGKLVAAETRVGTAAFPGLMTELKEAVVGMASDMQAAMPDAQRFADATLVIASGVTSGMDALAGVGAQAEMASGWAIIHAAIRDGLQAATTEVETVGPRLIAQFDELRRLLRAPAFNAGYFTGIAFVTGLKAAMAQANPLMQPLQPATAIGTAAVNPSTPGGPTVNVNMGGQTLNNQMDAEVLGQTISRVVVEKLRTST